MLSYAIVAVDRLQYRHWLCYKPRLHLELRYILLMITPLGMTYPGGLTVFADYKECMPDGFEF